MKSQGFGKISGSQFVKPSMLHLSAFSFFTSKLYILVALGHLLFYPKLRNMTSLERYFMKNLWTVSSDFISEDVRLMPGKVLKVLRRYPPSLFSYRKIRERVESAPAPLAGSVLSKKENRICCLYTCS